MGESQRQSNAKMKGRWVPRGAGCVWVRAGPRVLGWGRRPGLDSCGPSEVCRSSGQLRAPAPGPEGAVGGGPCSAVWLLVTWWKESNILIGK